MRERVEELQAAKGQKQQELDVHTLKLGALQLATKKLLSEEELRARALAEIEKARQRDIQRLREQIQSIAEREWFSVLFFFLTLHPIE